MKSGPSPRGVLYPVVKGLLKPVVGRLYRVETTGVEHVPGTGPVILAANHVSFIDSMMIATSIPRSMVYLAKAEYFESWKTGWLFRGLGMIPVRRGVRSESEAALMQAAGVLEQGSVLGLFPEGTRSIDGRLYRGRTGVARLALRSAVPVVPVGILGTREIMPKNARFPRLRGRVKLRFGSALKFDEFNGAKPSGVVLRKVTDQIMAAITSLSQQEYVDRYASSGRPAPVLGDFRLPTEEMLG